jgi:ElaB/YqjD/DUF883 family membrane-anchored ribosome-binding protein
MSAENNNSPNTSAVKIEITSQDTPMEANNMEDDAVKIEIIPQNSNALVDEQMAGESDEIKNETKALIEAIRTRAQAEAQSAGSLTRETYLNAVRRAREFVEENQPLIERDRLENSYEHLKQEAEKNWETIAKEIHEFGDRLADAAKAAWDAFTAPRSSN